LKTSYFSGNIIVYSKSGSRHQSVDIKCEGLSTILYICLKHIPSVNNHLHFGMLVMQTSKCFTCFLTKNIFLIY